MNQIKATTHTDMKDKSLGKVGTPSRDYYESKLQFEIKAYYIRKAIHKIRLANI
jgi:hypothetical protein